jgi:hypothetical protein
VIGEVGDGGGQTVGGVSAGNRFSPSAVPGSPLSTEVEVEWRGYHRLAVKGHMTDEELAAALAELDETRETAERELEAARARDEALRRLEHDRDSLMESYAGMVKEALGDLGSEERHRIYKPLRLGVRFRPDWPLEITGIFAEVEEEAEAGSSQCKPSPLSV